ncbi:MAG: IS200/IS605 family transposase [Candidatus Sumerlaeia bacterium]|nr:IS200/IS605 family transposase [Candidatus Sumerlaeia bacterium]
MPTSLSKNLVHLVYGTKNRRNMIDASVRSKLYAYQAGIFRDMECPAIRIGGMPDHVHALFVLSPNYALKQVVEDVKKSSSKWIKTMGAEYWDFYWQSGYGAFSVSQSQVGHVCRYIDNQEKHHRRLDFRDEYIQFMIKHEVEFDERYILD